MAAVRQKTLKYHLVGGTVQAITRDLSTQGMKVLRLQLTPRLVYAAASTYFRRVGGQIAVGCRLGAYSPGTVIPGSSHTTSEKVRFKDLPGNTGGGYKVLSCSKQFIRG
jgi:hypothetical protein